MKKLNFTIAEELPQLHTHKIVDLCDFLTAKVLEPMFKRAGWNWNPNFMNFFTFDNASHPLDPTGTIEFSVPPLLAGQVGEIERSIKRHFAKLHIKTGPFTYERNEVSGAILKMFIPIIENPTVLVTPPEVNMSHTRGYVVLRDILGYQTVDGRYEFEAEDLLKRVSSVTEDKIAACTASPVWDPKVESVNSTPSPASTKAVMRCLTEIKLFAQWAMTHNHRRLAAV
jgi:hypothetical protein